ncbi:MAG: hypothetical protein JNK49_05630 [Planctomycetes bacterium]|nr:hypothetical protein [Planctomycetota bacterium]
MNPFSLFAVVAVACSAFLWPAGTPFAGGTPSASGAASPLEPGYVAGGRYIGAGACKNCHNGPAKGDMYDHWTKTKHAQAFASLASDKAKEVGKKHGVDEPQKSEKCLKCHVTAYGLPPAEVKNTLKQADGVQCESCHGPGEAHQKKRFAEASKPGAQPSPITADETHSARSMDNCNKCHNQDSPTFQPFCLVERMKDVEHLDPRKKRTAEELAKLRETCAPDCAHCKETKAKAAADGDKKDGEKKDGGGGK